MGKKVLQKWDVGERKNASINISSCLFFSLLLVLPFPGLASMINTYYACPLSHRNIDLHEVKDVLIHPNGGAVNLSITSRGCNFTFNTSFTQKEIEHYKDLVESYSFTSWTKLAFRVYPSGLYVYPKLGQLAPIYTFDFISKWNSTRMKRADGNCLRRNSLRLDVSRNTEIAHECKKRSTNTHTATYTGSSHTYGYTYSRHIVWIPVGSIIVLCAACFRLCRLNCCPCYDRPRRQATVVVREPQPRVGSTHFAIPMPAPPPRYSETNTSPPPYTDPTELPPPYPGHTGDTEPSAPNFWVPPSAKKYTTTTTAAGGSDMPATNTSKHPTTTTAAGESDMPTANTSSVSPSTSDVPMLPFDPASSSHVSSEPLSPSPANNDDEKAKAHILSRFKNQFGFKRLQEQ